MGFRFRKSIGSKWFRVNFSKHGVGWSAGVPGLRYTKRSTGGSRFTAGIPGTGVSYVKETGGDRRGVVPKVDSNGVPVPSFGGRVFVVFGAVFATLVLVVFLIASIMAGAMLKEELNAQENGVASVQVDQHAFAVLPGYTEIQTILLGLEPGTSYADAVSLIESSGLEYKDITAGRGTRYITVYADKENESTNVIEATFYNVGDDTEYLRDVDFRGDNSALCVGFQVENESWESGETSIYVIDYSNKTGATYAVEHFDDLKSALDYSLK